MNAGLRFLELVVPPVTGHEVCVGTVRLELAQYNELKAFAQFGSDLDEATQKTLKRGEILRILKQGNTNPLRLGQALFAATRGHLDEYKASEVGRWEQELHFYLFLLTLLC